jgi:ABC-2 type transport system ATP-binding protein
VAFISHGEVVRELALASLDTGQVTVSIRAAGATAETANGLASLAKDIALQDGHLTLTVPNEDILPEINRYLVAHGVDVFEITPKHRSLEELFIETVGKEGGL